MATDERILTNPLRSNRLLVRHLYRINRKRVEGEVSKAPDALNATLSIGLSVHMSVCLFV